MSLFTKLLKNSVRNFIQKRRKWLMAFAVISSLAIVLNIAVNHYVDNVVSEIIKEYVREKSNDFYEVDFDRIAYVLNSGRFLMTNFRFNIVPDKQAHLQYEALPQAYLYTARIPRLHIDITDAWSIFMLKKLKVSAVEIDTPIIGITNLNKNKTPKKITFEAENLYSKLSRYLEELKINDFKIKNGHFDYHTYQGHLSDNFKLKGVNFEVKNLLINEKANQQKDKFFYSDDISLEVKNQLFLLKDSLNKITFDRFFLSTKNKTLRFTNFRLLDMGKNNDDKTRLNLLVPTLSLSGIDFVKAYHNHELHIDSVLLSKPMLSIERSAETSKDAKSQQAQVKIDVLRQPINVGYISLENGLLRWQRDHTQGTGKLDINHISATLQNLTVDTTVWERPLKSVRYDAAQVEIHDYRMTLPDSVHTIHLARAELNANPYEISLYNLGISTDSSVTSPGQSPQVNVNIPYMVMSGFNPEKILRSDSVNVKEIFIENPDVRVQYASKKPKKNLTDSAAGYLGFATMVQKSFPYFNISRFTTKQGKLSLTAHHRDGRRDQFDAGPVSLSFDNIYIDKFTDVQNRVFGNTSIHLQSSKNSLATSAGLLTSGPITLSSKQQRLQMKDVVFRSDSAKSQLSANIRIPGITLTGFNLDELLLQRKFALDSLHLNIAAIELQATTNNKTKTTQRRPKIMQTSINNLAITVDALSYVKDGKMVFAVEDGSMQVIGFKLDSTLSDNPVNQFNFDKVPSIHVGFYQFNLQKQSHVLTAQNVNWQHKNGSFSMKNTDLHPYGKTNNKYRIFVPDIEMTGIDLKKMTKQSYYVGEHIKINQPTIDLHLAAGVQKNPTTLNLDFVPLLLRNKFYGAKANLFEINKANIRVQQQTRLDSLWFEADNLDVLVDDFSIDSSTQMVPDKFLFSNDIVLHGDYISLFQRKAGNFYNINHLDLSTREQDIKLAGFYAGTNTHLSGDKARVLISGELLNIKGFDFFDLTQQKTLDIGDISIVGTTCSITPRYKSSVDHIFSSAALDSTTSAQNLQQLTDRLKSEINIDNSINQGATLSQTDSVMLAHVATLFKSRPTEKDTTILTRRKDKQLIHGLYRYMPDTSVIKKVRIGNIFISDTNFNLNNPEDDKKDLNIPDLWLTADGIRYDPQAALDSSRLFFSDHIKARISNCRYILPDKLSAISVDELTINSSDSSLKANNFALIPLVSRYDYGLAKGYQSTWLKIQNDSIALHKVDFMGIINQRKLVARTLNVDKLDISVFRDKRVPFPEWQRRPLPQTELKNIDFTIDLDTIFLNDGAISYQEHSEKAYTTGEVFFNDLNATIINLTNDSVRIARHPNTRIDARATVFGAGPVKAEFLFDMQHPDNINTYGVEVGPFALDEFNRILVPSASIKIKSGYNEKIIMNAKANENYSYGEMKFYYKDLKINLLNRETEKPKGLGNALGTFVANTFIIKSNNPKNLILRKGDIYFERDKKRAIFNYWTKTFLSGVTSSIGAVNNKKKIKKMKAAELAALKKQLTANSK